MGYAWMFNPQTATSPNQKRYQKSMLTIDLPVWNGNMSDLLRNCVLIQDKYAGKDCMSEDEWEIK